MPRRRLAVVAVLGVLAAAGLAACRADPAVAAYVGDTEHTMAEVDEIYEQLRDALAEDAEERRRQTVAELERNGEEVPEELREPAVAEVPVTRADIVQTLILGDLTEALATELEVEIQPVTAADIATAEQVPADTRYAETRAEMATYLLSWSGEAELLEPTEEDLRGIYDRAAAAGMPLAAEPFDVVAPELDTDRVRQALGVRADLVAAVQRYEVTVNPRFQPLEYPLLRFQGGIPALTVPLDSTTSDVVRDVG